MRIRFDPALLEGEDLAPLGMQIDQRVVLPSNFERFRRAERVHHPSLAPEISLACAR